MSRLKSAVIVTMLGAAFFAGKMLNSSPAQRALGKPTRTGKVSTSVYYQVTYANKTIRDLPTCPTTNKDILMVTRIATYRSSLPSYRTHSTGSTAVTELNPARTVTTTLVWNGSAWVDALAPVKYESRGANITEAQLREVGNQLVAISKSLDAIDSVLVNVADPQAPDKIRIGVSAARKSQAKAASALLRILLAGGGNSARANRAYRGNPAVLTNRVSIGGYGLPGMVRRCPKCGWHFAPGFFPLAGFDIITQTPNPDYESNRPKVKIETQN